MRKLADQHVDADMRASFDSVGNAEQDKPGEQIGDQFQCPGKAGTEDVAVDHLNEGDGDHQRQ